MKQYFRLYSNVFLFLGTKGSTIHDGKRKRIFELDIEHANIIKLAENNKSLQDISTTLRMPLDTVINKLNEIKDNELGTYLSTPSYVEKMNYFPKWKEDLAFKLPPRLQRGFIQLNVPCNKNCSYCESSTCALTVNCWRCSPGELQETAIDIQKIRDTVLLFEDIGIRDLFFSVPPTITAETLLNIVQFARTNTNLTVGVVSDFSILNDIKELGNYSNVQFILKLDVEKTILSKVEPIMLDRPALLTINLVTVALSNKLESFKEYLSQRQIPFSINMITRINDCNVPNRIATLPCDTKDLSYRMLYNPCLSSTITVNSNGTVFICPRMPQHSIADNFDIVSGLQSENYSRLRGLGMNSIYPCKTCELRSACNDCRFIEIVAGGNINECVTCEYGNR